MQLLIDKETLRFILCPLSLAARILELIFPDNYIPGAELRHVYQHTVCSPSPGLDSYSFFDNFINLLLAESSVLRGLFSSCDSEGSSSLQCEGFSLRRLLLFRSTGSRCTSFSSCGPQAQTTSATVVVHGLAASGHVASSWTKARTHVSCIGRRILYR